MDTETATVDVSVIVVSYNDRIYIHDCLTSLLDQDLGRDRFEVIFVDNGSNDGSCQYVRDNFPLVKVLELEKNYGTAEGYNKGVDYSLGRYLVFLNVDTVLHERWLSEMVKVLEENAGIRACQSNMLSPWASEFSMMERRAMPGSIHIYDLSKFGYVRHNTVPYSDGIVRTLFLSGASLIVEREIVDEEGFAFDTDLPGCADIDMGLRLNGMGYETVLVPASVVYHRSPITMKVAADRRSMRKAINFYQGLFLTYFKNMYTVEFLLFLPFLLLGAPLKVKGYGWSRGRQILYGIVIIPLSMYAFVRASMKLPKYSTSRKRVLRKRKKTGCWILKELMER